MIVSLYTFKRLKNHNLNTIGFWLIVGSCLSKKGLDVSSSAPVYTKYFLNILPVTISLFQVSWLNDIRLKRYIKKIYPTSCAAVTTFNIDGMAWHFKIQYIKNKMFFSVRLKNS